MRRNSENDGKRVISNRIDGVILVYGTFRPAGIALFDNKLAEGMTELRQGYVTVPSHLLRVEVFNFNSITVACKFAVPSNNFLKNNVGVRVFERDTL